MKKVLFLCLMLIVYSAIQAQTLERFLYFKHNSYVLSEEVKRSIDSTCSWMRQHPTIRFDVLMQGFASQEGSAEANQTLSANRVNAIKNALLNCNAASIARFLVTAEGATTQFSNGNKEENLKKNRCVKITLTQTTLVSNSEPQTQPVPSSPPLVVGDSLKRDSIVPIPAPIAIEDKPQLLPVRQWIGELRTPPQLYKIYTKRDTLVVTKRGLIVFIPKGAFNQCDSVLLTVQDYFTKTDMIRNQLSSLTVDNSAILYSQGMFYIDALCGKEPIQPIKPLEILVPDIAKNPVRPETTGVYTGVPVEEVVKWSGPNQTAQRTTWGDFGGFGHGDIRCNTKEECPNCCCPRTLREKLRYGRLYRTEKEKPCGKNVLFKSKKRLKYECAKITRNEKRSFEEYKKALKEEDRKNLEQSLLAQQAIKPDIEDNDPYYTVKIITVREVVNCDGMIIEITKKYKQQKPTCKLTILNTPDSTRQYWITYDRYNSAYPANTPIEVVSGEKVNVIYLQKDVEGTYTVGKLSLTPSNNQKPITVDPNNFSTKRFSKKENCLDYLAKLID